MSLSDDRAPALAHTWVAPPPWAGPAAQDDRHIPWAVLALVTALAVVLRAAGLNNGLWLDEIIARGQSILVPLSQIVTTYGTDNQHTLYSVLAHLSVGAFGDHPWSIRLPALVLGAASVPMLYAFAREVTSRTEALLASLFLAVAYHHVWYSQSARGYSMLAFLTLASSWLVLRGLERGRARYFVWYSICAALSVYAHLTMALLVLGHLLLFAAPAWLTGLDLIDPRLRRRLLAGLALAGVTIGVLYAPTVVALYSYFVVYKPVSVALSTPMWAADQLVRGLRLASGGTVGLLAASGVALVGFCSYCRQSRFLVGLFALSPALILLAGIALRRPLFPRFLFYLAGFAVLVLVRGALVIGRFVSRARSSDSTAATPVGLAIVAGMMLASIVALIPNYRLPKQDYDGPLRLIEARRAADEPVATLGVTTPIYVELYHRPFQGVVTLDDLQRLRAQGRPVWVVYTFADHIAESKPDLMLVVRTECVVQGVFRASMQGGDVGVCLLPALVQ